MASLLLDKEATQSSETTSLEGPFYLVSPKIEKDLLHTIEQTRKLRGKRRLGWHVLPAPVNECAMQLYHLANTTRAYDVLFLDISTRPEALSAASSKSARLSQTFGRNSTMSSESMPMLECQSFSIPAPCNSLTITERALQAFCVS